jgi:hypothetical protein
MDMQREKLLDNQTIMCLFYLYLKKGSPDACFELEGKVLPFEISELLENAGLGFGEERKQVGPIGKAIPAVIWSRYKVFCKDYEKLEKWMDDYLDIYLHNKLTLNNNFYQYVESNKKTRELLEKYKNKFGKVFCVKYFESDNFLDSKFIVVDIKSRIYEDLLLMQKSKILELSIENIANTADVRFLNVHVKLLKKIETDLTGALDYLGFIITNGNRVFYREKEIEFSKNKSDEFLLLKLLVEKRGAYLSQNEVYIALGYTPKRNKNLGIIDMRTVNGMKKTKKTPVNRKYQQQLQSCKTRLLERISDDRIKITANKEKGVSMSM